MAVPDQPCQELCSAIAGVAAVPVQVVGVCDYNVSMPFEDVTVTGSAIQQADAFAVSDTEILLSVTVAVYFTAVESPSGTPVSAQCETSMSVILTVAEPPAAVSDRFPCTTDLVANARYAGFEPALTPEVSAEEFIITVGGTVACTTCLPAVVDVGLCASGG